MRNLAGHPEAEHFIALELALAGVELVWATDLVPGEVPTRVTGKLGQFTFRRFWYYWVVDGNVPLSVAEELYAHPVGKRDVRVAGHCACPPPAEWASYIDESGRQVIEDPDGSQERDVEAFLCAHPNLRASFVERYVRDRSAVKTMAIVDNYHIDSQEGLNLFVETLRRHGLDKEAT